jgi:hypothetical protein
LNWRESVAGMLAAALVVIGLIQDKNLMLRKVSVAPVATAA